MTLFHWSRTAASNGAADITCPFPEGMGAPALNDGARGMMAAVAKYRDDIAGAIVTTGNLNSYSVLSYQGFDSLADMNGQEIAFSPHVTNGDTVVLNVDFLGSKPLRTAPGAELLAGTLILGTPYMAVYNNTDGAFYLKGYYASPFNVPFLGGMDHWDTIAPNSAFIFPQGQAISRTVYARTFARWGTKFGAGDGTTTFNVPPKAGRVSVMMEAAATLLTPTYFGGDSTQIGAIGGSEKHTQTEAEMAPHHHSAGIFDPGHNHSDHQSGPTLLASGGGPTQGGGFVGGSVTGTSTTGVRLSSGNGLDTTDTHGGGNPFPIVMPAIVCNYVIRIL